MRRSIRRGPRPRLAAALVGVWAACASCADLARTRDVRVTVLDEHGRPLPGAVFYVEAADDRGAFAFLWAKAGLAGEVPQSAREPLKLPWRRGAHLAMAAFAPGRRPAVLREANGTVISDGAVLELEAGSAWNPEIAHLAFPFPAAPALAGRLREPSALPLAGAFRTAWAACPDSTSAAAARRALDSLLFAR